MQAPVAGLVTRWPEGCGPTRPGDRLFLELQIPVEVDPPELVAFVESHVQNAHPALVVGFHQRVDRGFVGAKPATLGAQVAAQLGFEPAPRASGGVLVTVPGGHRLELGPEAVDAIRFERTVVAARRVAVSQDTAETVRLLTSGLDLWRGPPLVELGDEMGIEPCPS